MDSDGNKKEEIVFNEDGKIISKTSNKYNESGNVIETISEVPSANMKTKKVFKYDDDGNLTEQIIYNKLDQPVEVTRVVREYYD